MGVYNAHLFSAAAVSSEVQAAVGLGSEVGVWRIFVRRSRAAVKKIHEMLDSEFEADHNLISLLQRMRRSLKN